MQIEHEVKKYKYRDISCVCVYGGGSRREQINIVTKGVEIVVATPGRLNDLISNNIIDVKSVTYLVLDEADRMLDLGFEPEIRKILIDIRPDRQTIMTSATWPTGVRRLATSYMKNPIRVSRLFLHYSSKFSCMLVYKIGICYESELKMHSRRFRCFTVYALFVCFSCSVTRW